ncbi:MAG: glycerophosphodiester phosphodiesterase family protein, partial [Bdellovibrionales bacterium]
MYELENSMSSLRSAALVGAKFIEFDIHHTQDGEPILMHDKKLKRTAKSIDGRECEIRKKISDLTLSDIERNCQLNNGEDIPRLSEVLLEFANSDIHFFIELKDTPSVATLNLIYRFYRDRPDQVTIISFEKEVLDILEEDTRMIELLEGGMKLYHLAVFNMCAKKSYDGVGLRMPS